MIKDDFYYFGKILKTYGNEGHLLLLLEVDHPDKYSDIKVLFVGIENDRIPFLIDHLELKANKLAHVGLEDVNTMEAAKRLVGKEVFLPSAMLPPLSEKNYYFHEIYGFTVIDQHHGYIGIVESVLEMPQQMIMQIRFGEKEILLPLVDEFVRDIDRNTKVIHVKAPPGLIDIYL